MALLQETHFYPLLFGRQGYFRFLTCHWSTSSTCYEQILPVGFYFTAGNCRVLEFQDRASGYEEFYILMQTSIHDKSLLGLWKCEHPNF